MVRLSRVRAESLGRAMSCSNSEKPFTPGAPLDAALRLRLFDEVFAHGEMGIGVVDLTYTITHANPAYAALFGRTPEEMVGCALETLTLPEDWAWEREVLDRLAAGERPPGLLEKRYRLDDGSVLHVGVHPSVLRDDEGRIIGLVAMVTDRTVLHRREEALERSEERYRAIIETAVEAIMTVTPDGTILEVNPAVETMLGYTADDLVGRNVTILMPADEAGRHAGYMGRYLSTGERRVIGVGRDVPVRRKDGSVFAGWLALTEIKRPGFHVFVGTIRDVSQARQAEAALIQAKEAAELANRAKSAFLSNMSHELRTPLNGILGFADVVQQQMLGALENPQYLAYMAEIKRSGELLLANINDLLEVASIESGTLDLDETLMDFRDIVVSCLRLVGKRAERGKLKVQADIAAELPPVYADPRALKQVLMHLLSNAIKFTPAGGTIGLAARVDSDGGLVAEVFDTGIGIPEDRMESVMLPFVQGESLLTRHYEGVGLGLSIAKSLMDKHGGRLEIRSHEGVGTTVILRLPPDRVVSDW